MGRDCRAVSPPRRASSRRPPAPPAPRAAVVASEGRQHAWARAVARVAWARRAERQETLKEQVRSIEAFIKESMVSRAVGKVCKVATLVRQLKHTK